MRNSWADALYKSLDMVCDEMSPEQLEEAIFDIEKFSRQFEKPKPLEPVTYVETSLLKINWAK